MYLRPRPIDYNRATTANYCLMLARLAHSTAALQEYNNNYCRCRFQTEHVRKRTITAQYV